jgi:GTPase SAR1 family protein
VYVLWCNSYVSVNVFVAYVSIINIEVTCRFFCLFSSLICSDYLFKLLLIGDSGVGKSCLLLRFAVSS